jgi:hypothetical protein
MPTIPEPTSHRIGWIMCPYCTVLHDGAMGLKDQALPVDGDANICGKCFQVSVYDSSAPHGLRLPTLDEKDELMADPEIRRAISIARSSRHIIQRKRAKAN